MDKWDAVLNLKSLLHLRTVHGHRRLLLTTPPHVHRRLLDSLRRQHFLLPILEGRRGDLATIRPWRRQFKRLRREHPEIRMVRPTSPLQSCHRAQWEVYLLWWCPCQLLRIQRCDEWRLEDASQLDGAHWP